MAPEDEPTAETPWRGRPREGSPLSDRRPPLVASATSWPLRDAVTGVRSEVPLRWRRRAQDGPGGGGRRRVPAPEGSRAAPARQRGPGGGHRGLERPGQPDRDPGPAVELLVIDDLAPVLAVDPVVGPELAAARTRLGLTVDQLADRTASVRTSSSRSRSTTSAPCGGDFYARATSTLARCWVSTRHRCWRRTTSGTPTRPSTRAGSSRPSSRRGRTGRSAAPAGPELVGPGRRGHGRGARLVDRPADHDSPVELHPSRCSTDRRRASPGSRGPGGSGRRLGWGARGRRDGSGEVVFNGDLAFGDSRTVKAAPPCGCSRPTAA